MAEMVANMVHFSVEHIVFGFSLTEDGAHFVLRVASEPGGKLPAPLFSGPIHAGMAAQLRAAADHVEEIEAAMMVAEVCSR